jgi:DNA invertase Pin-like site-specific DNA recombinase
VQISWIRNIVTTIQNGVTKLQHHGVSVHATNDPQINKKMLSSQNKFQFAPLTAQAAFACQERKK